MTEEKKDDINEQESFLSAHEELLKSIPPKPETPDEQPEAVEAIEKTPVASEEQEAPMVEAPPMVEEPAPEIEPEPTEQTPVAQPLPKTKNLAPVAGPNKLGGKKKTAAQTQHSQQHEELLKKQALEQQEVKEVLVFLKKYTKPVAIGLAVICAIVLVDKFFKTKRYQKEANADIALMNARSADDLQKVLNDYASTPSGPMALMALAREKFNAGKIDEAEALYTRFSKKYGNNELAIQAELNLIACKESRGQLQDAQLLYGEFAGKHAHSYLAPSALMSKARCLETLGELDEARIVYEDIKVNFPDSIWSRQADANLKVVLRKR